MGRRRLVLLGMVLVGCGIDEGGLLSDGSVPTDATTDAFADSPSNDASKDVVTELPPSCTTLDVSACVDSGIPDGWSPVVTSATVTSCPDTANYGMPQTYVDKLGASGPCACGCTSSGSYSCTGNMKWATMCGGGVCTFGGCNAPVTSVFDAGGPSCISNGISDLAVQNVSVMAVGSGVGCDASVTTAATPTSSPVTACLPKCSADYCGVGTAFNKCIWSLTETTCPAPFVNQDTLGSASDISVACGCTCGTSQVGMCGATVSMFTGNANCTGTPFMDASVPLCDITGGTHVDSFEFRPNAPPTVACTFGGGTAPAVSFGSSKTTVCCL